MSGAALALALAVLVAPASSPRARVLMTRTAHVHRLAPAVGAVTACVAVAALMPWSAVVAVGLLAAAVLIRRRRHRQRLTHTGEAAALQGALDVLVGELRVGAHPVQAIGAAAAEADGRVGVSMGVVAARALLGADVAEGLRAEAAGSASPGHWERLAVCWQLAQSHGLAIATLVQAAQRDIAERERFRGRVEAGMAGARATASILAGLPVVGVLLGQSIGADPVRFLFSGGAGGWLLIVGVLLICGGLIWSDRITGRVIE